MSQETIFGTDGIRGRAGEGWLTLERAAQVGEALGHVLASGPTRVALLAHDGRRSGPGLEAAVARGLNAAGITCVSAGLLPTPGLAWLTREGDFVLGVMISASHNPAADNGIKVFSGAGDKLSDEQQAAIEARLHEPAPELPETERPSFNPELENDYLKHLVDTIGAGLNLSGLSIVLDCAHGAGSRVGPKVFGRLGALVHTIGTDPDGENINHEVGSTHPEALMDEVRSRGAGFGVALDGDGDRCMLVDEQSNLVHGDGILTVLGRHAASSGKNCDSRLVATIMSNRGLHRALREVGVDVVEVGVGDRQVVEALRKESLSLGGEQSGHVILGESNAFIGDGLVTALAVLRVMKATGASLSSLVAPYQPFPQVLINVRVSSKPQLRELPEVIAMVRHVEQQLGVDGRVLLRYSGTEDLARVMVEGPDEKTIHAHANALVGLLTEAIGA
ncbi:MAG: phosphoglucosamine mutase [Planctomycetota bacterium]